MRREAHVPRGGADGGDGGGGGSVIFRVDPARRDLAHLRRKLRYAAEDGGSGQTKKRHGKNGEDCIVLVPRGTQVFAEDGRRICDLTRVDEEHIVAEGGYGGRGNTHFTSSVRRAPDFAEIGLPGPEIRLELRLKLMADAALAGIPNAGKSSLLRRISNAKPKVGSYPFTTLAPVLGTIERPDGSQVVVVDVPGLLEGAADGHGMGHEFLAHFERAHMIVHMVSLEDIDAIGDNMRVIQNELWRFDPRIARLPQVVLLTKSDLVDDAQIQLAYAEVDAAIARGAARRGATLGVHALSAITGQGLGAFLQTLFRGSMEFGDGGELPSDRHSGIPLDEYRVYRPRPTRRRWRIFRSKEGFRVAGEPAMHALAEHAEEDHQALLRLHDFLESGGALHALKAAGARSGESVDVFGVRLELNWDITPEDILDQNEDEQSFTE